MKEKKILIVTLLGMPFHVQAGLMHKDSAADVDSDLNKIDEKKPTPNDISNKKSRVLRRSTDKKDELAKEKHRERRAAQRVRKHIAYEERNDKKYSDKKGAEPVRNERKENFQAAERREDARLKAEERREQSLERRKEVAVKKVSRLETELDKLKDREHEEIDKRSDSETRVIQSHLINKKDGIRDLDKDIANVQERLSVREKEARKLSEEYRDEKKDEYKTRLVLAKVYSAEQKELQRKLSNVKHALAQLRVKDKKAVRELAKDRLAYQEVHRDVRASRAVKNTARVHENEKKLGIRPSDEQDSLEKELDDIKKKLIELRVKIDNNDKAIDQIANLTGLEPRKEQKRKEMTDHYIKEGKEKDLRPFSQVKREIEERKEDLAYQDAKKTKKIPAKKKAIESKKA